MKQILTILKTNLKRKSLLLLNVLIRPLPKTKGAEDAAPDPESAACNKGSETADTEAESATAESEEEDAEKESCADREVSPQEESEVTAE